MRAYRSSPIYAAGGHQIVIKAGSNESPAAVVFELDGSYVFGLSPWMAQSLRMYLREAVAAAEAPE